MSMGLRALLIGLLALALPVRAAPERVVAVGGDMTEIVYALGAGSRLVGADSTSVYPPEADALPKVGYMRSLSTEGVLSLRPDLLIASAVAGPPGVLEQIGRIGVHVVRAPEGYDYAVVREKIRRVGDALAMPAATARVLDDFAQAQARTEARVAALKAAGPAPSVLFIMAHGAGVQVAGDQTAGGRVIELAGGRNAVGRMAGYKPITAEAVIHAAPEVILVSTEGLQIAGGIDGVLALPGVADTPAGRARRVVDVDGMALLGFSLRLPAVVRELAEALHARPDAAP